MVFRTHYALCPARRLLARRPSWHTTSPDITDRLEKCKPLCFVLDGPRFIAFNTAKNQSFGTACSFDATLPAVGVWNRGARMFYKIRSTKSWYALHLIAVVVLTVLPLSQLRAQVAGATLSGEVTDTTGTRSSHLIQARAAFLPASRSPATRNDVTKFGSA